MMLLSSQLLRLTAHSLLPPCSIVIVDCGGEEALRLTRITFRMATPSTQFAFGSLRSSVGGFVTAVIIIVAVVDEAISTISFPPPPPQFALRLTPRQSL